MEYLDVIANSFIQSRGCKLYNKLVHECSRDVLNKKVVSVPPRKVYVEDQSKRVWNNDFVLVQFGHVDIQCGLGWLQRG